MKEYVVYKGDSFLCMGTVYECAKHMGVLPETVRFYTTPTYQKRVNQRKNPKNYITVTVVEDDEEDFE
jgi:hypothetical protein